MLTMRYGSSMAAVKTVLLHVEGYQAWGNLMSTEEGTAHEKAKLLVQQMAPEEAIH